MFRRLFCHVAILLTFYHVSGQNPLNQFYEIDNLDSKELIKGVVRDHLGFVWVATDDGILRYDGKETLVSDQMAHRYAKEFFLSKENVVWLIHDTGIERIESRIDSISFEIPDSSKQDFSTALSFPKSIYEDKDSILWIGEIDAIVRIDDHGLKRYKLGTEYQSISYHHSFSFSEDAFGHLWVAPFKGSLLSYDETNDEFVSIETDERLTEVSAITTVRGDHLLISGKEGLLQIKIDGNKDVLDSRFIQGPGNISDMETVGNNHVYIATWDQGLFYWDFELGLGTLQKISEVSISDIVNLSYSQRNREIWIAGGESVGVLKQTQVKTIDQVGKIRIESLAFDERGGIYFSSGEPVHYLNDITHGKLQRILYSSETFFSQVFYDQEKLWIGDFFGSIYYYKDASDRPIYITKDLGGAISYVTKDKKGDKWFSGVAGVVKVDGSNNSKIYRNVQASNVIKEDNYGRIVCGRSGTDSLVYRYDETTDQFMPVQVGLPTENQMTVNDLDFDQSNNLWLATDQGLYRSRYSDGVFGSVEKISFTGYQDDENIRAIAISEQYIWLAYPDGLILYDGEESVLFNRDSGLPSNILKERGLKFGPQGDLYVFTAKGLATIDENLIKIRKSKAPVVKAFFVNSDKIDLTRDALEFSYNSHISCDFMSLSFPHTKLQYQTRVMGYDESWSTPSSNSNLSILGFSEGIYTLQIRAKKGGRLWSDPTSVSFKISEPWFLKWWSIALFFLGAGMIVLLTVQIHNRNLIRQKRKLHAVIDRRTQEIQNQKNEIINQQERLIKQKEELLQKNQVIHDSEQARDKAELNFLHLKEKQLEEQIEYKNKQITTHALNILQKNESLKELRVEINAILEKPEKQMITELKKTLKLIDGSFKLDKDWEDFKLYFEQIYTGFYAKLKVNFPDITNSEMRHCALIRLNLPIAECASILGISHDSVKVSRSRLRKKLGLQQNQNLSEYIMSL